MSVVVSNFRRIVRAVIINNGKVLLCKASNRTNYFLPGGGIELEEAPTEAIHRELQEELHAKIASLRLIKQHENEAKDSNKKCLETIFVYEVQLENAGELVSIEEGLSFYWKSQSEIMELDILPKVHSDIIIANLKEKR